MKKALSLIMSVVLVIGVLSSCGSNTGEEESKTVRVGTLPFAGSVPVAYALEQGYFDEAGITVEQYEFATGAPMNEAFAAGQLDVAVIGLAGVVSMSAGNAVCVYETKEASGGNGIFVREDSPLASGDFTAEDLKGITIIGQLATSSQLMTIQFLEEYGLTQEDINFTNMDTGADYQAFKSGEGDAVALMTPYAWNAEDDGYVCIYNFAEECPYMVPDTMLVTKDYMESSRDLVKQFLEVYLKALEELRADDQLMFDTSKEYYAACGREYQDEYVQLDLETRHLLAKEDISQPDYVFGQGMWEVAKIFVQSGQIEEANLQNVIDCLDPSLIEEITGVAVVVETGD